MQEQKTIKDFSIIELKAIVYDTMAQIEQLQRELKVVNQEIGIRQQEPQQNVIAPVEPEHTDEEPKNEK